MPVFGTQASRFNDDGVTALYQGLLGRLVELGLKLPLAGVAEIVKSNGRPVPAALVAESVAKNCPGRGGVPDSAPVVVSIESQAGRSVAS
jgi:hypothetical protein